MHKLQEALQPTVGDCLLLGQIARSQIRKRTLSGVDSQGASFASYSTKGPYYFYPNGDVGSTRGGSAAVKQARATAAKNRFSKLGGKGVRTPYGIRYESYAAAKDAHGGGTVNLFGMEQHPHMLDAIIVRAGGAEIDQTGGEFLEISAGDELDAFAQGSRSSEFFIGIYDDRSDRGRGHNEGSGHLPRRHWFDLNAADYDLMRPVLIARMRARANSPRR
jgi:hypothetical protein